MSTTNTPGDYYMLNPVYTGNYTTAGGTNPSSGNFTYIPSTTSAGNPVPYIINTQPGYNWGFTPPKPKRRKRYRNKDFKHFANVDKWYIAPKDYIQEEEILINIFSDQDEKSKSFMWAKRLAHECSDGKLRAPTGVKLYKNKKRVGYSVYGKCSHCGDKIPKSVKMLINLEEMHV